MDKRLLVAFFGFVLVVGIFSFVGYDSEKEDNFSCDNLGLIYAKPSEINKLSEFKEYGAIIRIPELDIHSAKTEVLKCPNIDLYLGYLKQWSLKK